MRHNLRAKIIALALAAVCILLVVVIQSRIDLLYAGMENQQEMPRQLPLAAAASAALGGFRGIAVDILWIQADSMLNRKQFYQLAAYYESISVLQPNFPAVWRFNSWNLAYNISAEWARPEEKWEWIKKGVHFAKKGLEFNPSSNGLHMELAVLYYRKVGSDPYFVRRLREDEGLGNYQEAYRHGLKAGELARQAGENDIRERGLAYKALFEHGKVVLKETGNLPETKRIFVEAEQGVLALIREFPEDLAVQQLLNDIRDAKYSLRF